MVTWVGGCLRDQLHPSAQVGQYKMYLEDNHTAFDDEGGIGLHACAYLHNYEVAPGDAVRAEKFSSLLATYPAFSKDEVDGLIDFLRPRLVWGEGESILGRIDKGGYLPSKKLLDHVANVIAGAREYVLLGEQLIAFDRVLEVAKKAQKTIHKTVILIKGGPGTGKSLIAMNLIGALSRDGCNAHYATGSKTFPKANGARTRIEQ